MTRRERQVASWFHDRIAETGAMPPYQEAAAELGVRAETVGVVMRRLRHLGHVERGEWRGGRRVPPRITLPGRGLMAAEVAWCHANPERVRAMIELAGSTVQ